MPELIVASLGWGTQSTALVAMSALGYRGLPKLDFAIHADTTWERAGTYEYAKQMGEWLEAQGVTVITVSDPKQAEKAITSDTDMPAYASLIIPLRNGSFETTIPAHTASPKGGMLRRQCTQRWKIQPIRKFIAQELGCRGLPKSEGVVEQWLGISTDERHRAGASDVKYIKHRFPLLELGISRQDCISWLASNGLPQPGKSACTFCPYHNKKTWQGMKRENGPDWQQAVAVDLAIRDKRPPYDLFVHPTRKPLNEAVMIPEDYGATQLELLDVDPQEADCESGYCFL